MNNLTPEQIQRAIDYFNEVLPYMGSDRGLPHFATAIAALESAQDGWIAVSERLPTKADGMVLAWSSKLDEWQAEEWSYVISGSRDNYTHWRPLPAPPELEGEG